MGNVSSPGNPASPATTAPGITDTTRTVGRSESTENVAPPDNHPGAVPKASKRQKAAQVARKILNTFVPSRGKGKGKEVQPPLQASPTSPQAPTQLSLPGTAADNTNISDIDSLPPFAPPARTGSIASSSTRARSVTSAKMIGRLPTDQEQLERHTQFYEKRVDLPDLVRMKLNGEDFPENSGFGVSKAVYFMAARFFPTSDMGNPKAKGYNLLVKDRDDSWHITNAYHQPVDLPDGRYIFVTMADGSIRIGNVDAGPNAHCTLSGNAAYVRYAGEIQIENGKPVKGRPQSGTYMPHPDRWHQSGIECEVEIDPGFYATQELYEKTRRPLTPAGEPSQSG